MEGPSDQHYLSAIKNYLIGRGLITPKREILFVPAGGIKGVNAVAPILSSNNEALPNIILDSDSSGQGLAKQLKSNFYSGAADRIIMVGDFWKLPNVEIEDLFPISFLAKIITRYLRGPKDDFSDEVVEGEPMVPQVQKYAQKYGLKLEPGWKVEVAKQTKTRLLQSEKPLKSDDKDVVEMWKALFLKMES